MYKVDLSEKEVREVGINRHVKTNTKLKLATFIIGLIVVCVGVWFYAQVIGKVLMFGGGTIWVLYTLYQSHKDGKAGEKFLEEVKNAENDN